MTCWPNGLQTIPRVSGEWGPRVAPIAGASTFHHGIDLVGWANNKSPMAGVITRARYNGGAGNQVIIRGDNGDTFVIDHAKTFLVKVGQRVAAGQDVSVMGMTGTATGVHCHLETHPGGGADVNPRVYMSAAIPGGSFAGGGFTPIESDDNMPLTDSDIQRIWSFKLGNKGGRPGAVFGRAADWLTNMSDAMQVAVDTGKRIEGIVSKLGTAGFTPEQVATISKALKDGLALPTEASIAKAVNDDAAARLKL